MGLSQSGASPPEKEDPLLQFVLGRAGSGKTEYLRRLLADLGPSAPGGAVLLVPEQFTFETEKAMLRLAGPVAGNAIPVYSFTRLAEAVFRREGGAVGRRLSDGGRRILMACAIEACQDRLEVYAAAARGGRVTDVMLGAVNEMKMCGISPADLLKTSRALGERGLGKKLAELALLYDTYDALVAASYLDSRDDLTRLAQALETSDFFAGCTVAVDSFEGFTAQELAVLTQIMRRAERVVVALCTDGLDRTGTGLFALVDRTRRRLSAAAQENGVALLPPVELTGAPRFRNENLKLVEAQLFCAQEAMTSPDSQGVCVFEARDPYEEAEFVAAAIRRLVSQEGYRYREVSIICRDPARYYGCLDAALKKRDIPCFVSQPAKVDGEPVTRFALGAFQAVQSGFQTEPLLELLKTGVSGFSAEEISSLENYAYLWRLSGPGWRQEFARHPQGFGREFTEADRQELSRLNALRQRLIGPLERFAARTRSATGAELSQAVYLLLMAFGMEENLPAYCRALEDAGEAALAQKQLRVWDLLMETLDQMRAILGERPISRERYFQLLKEVIAGEDVSEIPQTVDQVLFGTAEQVRQAAPRAAFLLGAAQGEFPLAPRSSGVFSDAERKELIARELPLGDPLEQKTIEERYLAYSVACAPSERLYVTWPRTADGEDKEPSELVSALLGIFPGLRPLRDLPDEFFANSREAAFSRMAARFTEADGASAALRELFAGDPAYRGRLEALERAAGRGEARVRDPALAQALFGERPFLSPTQVEAYFQCPFQYFCRYGLNARERRPAQVDVLQYGTLMHYLFEQVFRQDPQTRAQWDDGELERRVAGLIEAYARENLGGLELLSGREKYRLERLAQSACKLIRHVEEELAQSRFVPERLEWGLGAGRDAPPLRVPTSRGFVTVGGTIDRADIYVSPEGERFVRVIDYKTGKKAFHLSDALWGLNMQMLVYLAALVESGRESPAGVLYMPAAEPSVSVERGTGEEKIKEEADKQLKMSGVVLSDQEIIRAMEDGARGKFIPASLNKDGSLGRFSSALSGQELRTVLEYSKRLIATMGEALLEGRVEAAPNMKNHSACRFCPYSPVCGRELGDRDIQQDKTTAQEALRQMEQAVGEGGSTHG